MRYLILNFILLLTFQLFSQQVWELANYNLPIGQYPKDISSTESGEVYLICQKWEGNDFVPKFYTSSNHGNNWNHIQLNGVEGMDIPNVVYHNDEKLFIGGYNSSNGIAKLYSSLNEGSNWSSSNSGIPQGFSPNKMTSNSNGRIFIVCGNYDFNSNSFKTKLVSSTNNGATWSEIQTTGLGQMKIPNSIHSIDGKLLVAGYGDNNYPYVFISSNEGVSWTSSASGIPSNYIPIDITSTNDGTLYLLCSKQNSSNNTFETRVFKSENLAASWSEITVSGLNNVNVPTAITSSNSTMIITGYNSDNGACFIFLSQLPTSAIHVDSELSFDETKIGEITTKSITLENTGDNKLNISSISYPQGFYGDWDEGAINAGATKQLVVTFSPTEPKMYSGNIVINSDAATGNNQILVSGTGVNDPTSFGEEDQSILFNLYPNPAKTNIYLDVDAEIMGEVFVITDLLGRVQIKGEIYQKKSKVSIEELPSGVYYISVLGKPMLKRVVVKK